VEEVSDRKDGWIVAREIFTPQHTPADEIRSVNFLLFTAIHGKAVLFGCPLFSSPWSSPHSLSDMPTVCYFEETGLGAKHHSGAEVSRNISRKKERLPHIFFTVAIFENTAQTLSLTPRLLEKKEDEVKDRKPET
jgi:hypothetical protein